MSKILHILHSRHDVSTVLPNSILLTSVDCRLDQPEYHTSLGDLSAISIISLAKNFRTINLIDCYDDKTSAEWEETKILLNYLSHTHVINNYKCSIPLKFLSTDRALTDSTHPRLWIFGCSHSHGVGLKSNESKFGELLGTYLNLPTTFVTQGGSSLQWSLRHLINANIKSYDTVIWQITTPGRITVYNQVARELPLANATNPYLLEVYTDQQIFFQQCSFLNYGVQYLRSLKVKFIMTSILNPCDNFYQYLSAYTSYPEYCYSPGVELDRGTDNLHLGPLSHKALAQCILNHVQLRNDKFI